MPEASQDKLRVHCAGVIPVNKKDNTYYFLLVEHKDGHWGFPKGHAEGEESEVETARRELLEETGIKEVRIHEQVVFSDVYAFQNGDHVTTKEVKYFMGTVHSQDVQIGVDEIKSFKWATFEEAHNILTFESAKTMLQNILHYLG